MVGAGPSPKDWYCFKLSWIYLCHLLLSLRPGKILLQLSTTPNCYKGLLGWAPLQSRIWTKVAYLSRARSPYRGESFGGTSGESFGGESFGGTSLNLPVAWLCHYCSELVMPLSVSGLLWLWLDSTSLHNLLSHQVYTPRRTFMVCLHTVVP